MEGRRPGAGPGRAATALALALTAIVTLIAAPAAPGELSREQARQLAAAARDDPAALTRLQAVKSIDGLAADTEAALLGARGAELARRLQTLELALAEPVSGGDAAAARADARRIVSSFPDSDEQSTAPQASSPDEAGGRLDLDLGLFWIPLLVVAIAAGAVLALRLARNRERQGRLEAEAAIESRSESLGELEQQAREAEAAGDFERALRLYYRIALRALQEQGSVSSGPAVTPSRVRRELANARAEPLVGTFERVVYGGRRAGSEDARQAREGWPIVVRESAGA